MKHHARLLLPMIAVLLSVPASAAIFGVDDRSYVTPSSPLNALGRSTAISILNTMHSENELGQIDLDVDQMSTALCPEDRFYKDPSSSYACSGFLVGPNLLVTAGHCVSNGGEVKNEPEAYCKVYDWLFDYQASDDHETSTTKLPGESMYHCKRIIYAVNNGESPASDYALIELDRDVVGRTPLSITKIPASYADEVFMIGYPLGTPMKLTANGHVKEDTASSATVLTDLDAFDGNSGSAVFNSKNEIAGILVSGRPTPLFTPDPVRSCSHYNVCAQDGTSCTTDESEVETGSPLHPGADVQRIAPLVPLIEEALRARAPAPVH